MPELQLLLASLPPYHSCLLSWEMISLAFLTLQQVLPMQAGDLAQDLAVLEQAAAAQEPLAQQAVEASHALAAGLRLELQRTRGFERVIAAHLNGEPHPCCSSDWRDHPAARELGEDVLGDIFPWAPRCP